MPEVGIVPSVGNFGVLYLRCNVTIVIVVARNHIPRALQLFFMVDILEGDLESLGVGVGVALDSAFIKMTLITAPMPPS